MRNTSTGRQEYEGTRTAEYTTEYNLFVSVCRYEVSIPRRSAHQPDGRIKVCFAGVLLGSIDHYLII